MHRKFTITAMKTVEQGVGDARAVGLLRALANPARFRIVQLLAARNACVCGQLVSDLPLAQSGVRHLKVLGDVEVLSRARSTWPEHLCLDQDAMQFLSDIVGGLARRACC